MDVTPVQVPILEKPFLQFCMVTAQCTRAAKTAQTVLRQIARTFHYRDRHIFLRLYKQYVRPHLEFSTSAWAPWTEGDRNCLEKVQQRAFKMVSGLKNNIYEEAERAEHAHTVREETPGGHGHGSQDTPRERWAGPHYLVRKGWEWTKSYEKHGRPLQSQSEAWQTGSEAKLLQYQSDRGLEPDTNWYEENGKKWKLQSCLPKNESDLDEPRDRMSERTWPTLMRAWHPGADVPHRGPTWTTGDYTPSIQVSK